jgi:integrin beta 3
VRSDDDGRTLIFEFRQGDVVQLHEVKTAVVLDRGVWREGEFAKGDGVSSGGSFWIAQKDTKTKPDTIGSDWRLAVKRGRDGKEGKTGEKGAPGPRGEQGLQGIQGYRG